MGQRASSGCPSVPVVLGGAQFSGKAGTWPGPVTRAVVWEAGQKLDLGRPAAQVGSSGTDMGGLGGKWGA